MFTIISHVDYKKFNAKDGLCHGQEIIYTAVYFIYLFLFFYYLNANLTNNRSNLYQLFRQTVFKWLTKASVIYFLQHVSLGMSFKIITDILKYTLFFQENKAWYFI